MAEKNEFWMVVLQVVLETTIRFVVTVVGKSSIKYT